jgi:hypothetical protein
MNTDRLIERLARQVEPARPLQRPLIRAAMWTGGAIVYVATITLLMTSRADLSSNLVAWKLLFPQLAAAVTGAAAAVAAFASTVPGYSRRILLLPAVAGLLWFGSLAGWSLQEWTQGVSVAAPGEWRCVAMIVGGGAVPAVFMAMMLRRGAPLTPGVTTALGALAVTGLANVSACLSQPHPNSAVVLVWHGLTIAALDAIAAWMGRDVLNWKRLRAGVLRSGDAV